MLDALTCVQKVCWRGLIIHGHGHGRSWHRHLHVHCDARLVSADAYVTRAGADIRCSDWSGGFDKALA